MIVKSLFLFILLSSFTCIEEKERFICEREFRSCCKFRIDDFQTPFFPHEVCDGDIIFVRSHLIPHFFTKFHPFIPSRFILITHGPLDELCPEIFFPHLDNHKLIAWFGCNIERCGHHKFHPIPCGVRSCHLLNEAVRSIQECPRTIFMLLKTHLSNRCVDQNFIENFFRIKPFCTFSFDEEINDVLRELAATEFVLCPSAPFVDCHLIWEAIFMGAIPIVRTSDMDCLFKDLPVLIIDNWRDITPEFLEKKRRKFRKKKFCLEKLQMDFWLRKIDCCRLPN